MNLDPILRELRAERDRLDRAIASLEKLASHRSSKASGKAPGKTPGKTSLANATSRRGRKSMSAAERKQVSQRMKEYWRSRRG